MKLEHSKKKKVCTEYHGEISGEQVGKRRIVMGTSQSRVSIKGRAQRMETCHCSASYQF